MLLQLDLRYNDIGSDGAKPLADALRVNASITQVCQIRQVLVCGAEQSPTRHMPLSCIHVWQVNLALNEIGSEGAKPLADALRVNASITSVRQIRQVMRCLF